MTIWIDAHLSPTIAPWISKTFNIRAFALRDLGLRDAEDPEIFEAGKAQQIIWLTFGNTSNAQLKEILTATLPRALEILATGESLLEISGNSI